MEVFDLGVIPLGFPKEQSMLTNIWMEKLELILCKNCYLIQTKNKIPHEKLAEENLYRSESAKIVSNHDQTFMQELQKIIPIQKDSTILEIGSGDGTLLKNFSEQGLQKLIGIEPSIHDDKSYSFEIIQDFFNDRTVTKLINDDKIPDVIISNYVIELIPDLFLFFNNLQALMKENSYFIIEVPYFFDFVENHRFDGFAHLRCNWFTVKSLVNIFNLYNLEIVKIQNLKNYRGGTIRAIVKKSSNPSINEDVNIMIKIEEEKFSKQFFSELQKTINSKQKEIMNYFHLLKNENLPIFGYGGGLKSSVLINWLKLSKDDIEMTFDADPNKENKFIPEANIPIFSTSKLRDLENNCIIINFSLDHRKEVEEFLQNNLPVNSKIVHLLPKFVVKKVNKK